MSQEEIEFECEEQMAKAVDFLRKELRGIRSGRASPGLVEYLKVPVESYGSTMDLRELASISVAQGNQLVHFHRRIPLKTQLRVARAARNLSLYHAATSPDIRADSGCGMFEGDNGVSPSTAVT